jgi:PAS domain S-box-containing protein
VKSVGNRFLVPFGMLAVLLSVLVLYQTYRASRRHARELLGQQVAMALEFDLAIRDYAAAKIRPAMERLGGKDLFVPEAMSTSFISRNIFDEVKKKYPDCILGFSSDNPRNPANLADTDELRMLDYFRKHPEAGRRSAKLDIGGKPYLALFTPRWITQDCLQCHGDPKDAPAVLLKMYGSTASFYRKVGDLAGLDMAAVPVEAIDASLASDMRSQSVLLIIGLAAIFASILLVFRLVVTRRLVAMATHFNEIASQSASSRMTAVEVKGNDEISELGVAFNKLLDQLRSTHALLEERVSARTAELARANERLKSELAERHKMEETLSERTELLKATLESTADGILVVNEIGRIITANAKFFEMWRIPADLAESGKDAALLDFVQDQILEPEAFMEKVRRLYDSGADDLDIISFKDGRTFERYSCTLTRRGKWSGRVWSFRDISEQRRTVEALRESEEQFRALVESAPDAILIQTRGCFAYMNKAAVRLYKANSESELLGRPVLDLIHPDSRTHVLSRIQRINDEREPAQAHEQIHLMVDGTAVDVEVIAAPISYKNDNGALVFVRDITERKRAQEALRLTQFSIDHAAEPIYWIGPDSRILYVNEAACRSLGYTKEELLALSVSDIDPLLPPEKWPDMWERSRRRVFMALESEHRRKDGSTFPIELNINVLAFGGREFSLAFVKDISERKQAANHRRILEAQLRHAQKMEAIGTLAGGIAHDFNNILAAIIGYTEMALANLSIEDDVRQDLEQVLNAGHRAKDLVKQILGFSRMSTGETHQSIEVGRIVREAIKFLRASLPATIEIRHKFEAGAFTMMGDATQIQELLMNLCTNASHAMEESGGILELSLSRSKLPSSMVPHSLDPDNNGYLKLTVSDTGRGMDPETMEHIFEPYFTTKEVGKGTGFGLAVVHSIVKRHGGFVTVVSEPGKGTVFEIYLPSAEGCATDRNEPDGPVVGGSERILYVDDEQALARLAKSMLEPLGYRVDARTGSTEALNVFRANPCDFDLVITDYTMPQMNGADLAKEMLAIRPDIPIILCTGFSERITEEKAGQIGIREFVMKPVDRRSITAAIRKVLDTARGNDECRL